MDALFFAHLFNSLLMIAMPIALGFFLTRKFHLGWRLWLIGAAGFVLSQVGHIPFNALVTLLFRREILPQPPEAWSPYFNPVFLGLSAGLWEELTRWAIYKTWARDARSWRKGVLLGAGHGGIEAAILGGLTLVTFIYMTAIRNADLSAIFPAEQLELAQQQVNTYWSTPVPAALLGALERALTIPLHIAFSVLVLQTFTRGQSFWVWLAVLWHALVDAMAVYLVTAWSGQPWGFYAIEGVIAIFTALSLAIIFALRRPEPPESGPVEVVLPPPPPIQPEELQREITEEDLDRSRYTGG